jgi:hypothetical protein
VPPDLTAMCAVTSDSVAAQPIPALSVSPTSRSMRRVEWFTLLDHRWELANQLDSDEDRKISTAADAFVIARGAHHRPRRDNGRWPVGCLGACDLNDVVPQRILLNVGRLG